MPRSIEARRPRDLLSRILDAPDLARVIQGLEPSALHRLVRVCGLEDCGPIVAVATTEQLMRVFDEDLWRSERAGAGEEFDADRFGVWIDVLAEAGPEIAARKIVEMDFDFVTAAFSRHLLVLDQDSLAVERAAAAVELSDQSPEDKACERARVAALEQALASGISHDVGGYSVIARRTGAWGSLLSVLTQLDTAHRDFFDRLMRRCCWLSTEYIADNGGLYEVLTSEEQVFSDVAGAREERRERSGYVAPPQAVAFLSLARREAGSEDAPSAQDPVTAAYFRTIDPRADERDEDRPPDAKDVGVGRLVATLRDAGVLPRARARLRPASAEGARLSLIREHLLRAQDDDAGYARRTQELSYLANVLIAGCSFQSRRFRAVEAADAALAICNLGLENGPARWRPDQNLVAVFRVGWSVLYEQVCLHVARRLAEILSDLASADREVRRQLGELSRRLTAEARSGAPWREREALDVIAILDQPSWATLRLLLDECPVVPSTAPGPTGRRPLRVTTEFEFISENRQIAWVRDFVESLPARLG